MMQEQERIAQFPHAGLSRKQFKRDAAVIGIRQDNGFVAAKHEPSFDGFNG